MDALVPLAPREFGLYGLSLPQGPNFEDGCDVVSALKTPRGDAFGAVLHSSSRGYQFFVMRRRVDFRFVETGSKAGLLTVEDAFDKMVRAFKVDTPLEPLRPGDRRRPRLLEFDDRTPSDIFRLLVCKGSHYAAMRVVGETYLAMPNPDRNFVSDMQTSNFDARLWELYLFACFKEQGAKVSQDVVSPDFLIEREGAQAYIEAVTASNPSRGALGEPVRHAPEDKAERMAGAPAERFAKTLHSKLQRAYQHLPHVKDFPFALAIADFHGQGTMVWSREALPTYLYGKLAVVREGQDGPYADGEPIERLRGKAGIPAGLFLNPEMRSLSAVIFSNAGTMAKFNRMGLLAGFAFPGIRMIRTGTIYDRTPGALKPIEFSLDITSEDYTALWPGGEAWCQELEIFHNPLAERPFPFSLLPGATHWFEREGEVICQAFWENTVTASTTLLQVPHDLEEAIEKMRSRREGYADPSK